MMNIARGTVYKGVKVIGSTGNLEYILPENKLDENSYYIRVRRIL